MADRETQLLVLSKVASCTIQNCRFIANAGGYMSVTLVWFKGCTNVQQVKVIDSYFQHDGGYNAEEEKHLAGGCIWFSGDDAEKHKLSNILVESCIFSTSTSDEILAFWNGTFENVVVQNCYFTNCYQSSDNFIAFNSSYFKDVILSNCIFTINENCLRVVKLNGLKGSNITVQGCDFYLLTNADAPWTDQLCIFSAANSSKKGNVTYNIIECNAISNDSTVYRAIINTSYTKNVTINVKHCLFDANVAGGIWWKEKAENIVVNIEK